MDIGAEQSQRPQNQEEHNHDEFHAALKSGAHASRKAQSFASPIAQAKITSGPIFMLLAVGARLASVFVRLM
jgi:hypothetical protein